MDQRLKSENLDHFRVVLVEDEYWTLEGLKLTINWSDFAMKLAGSFLNPKEALEHIRLDPPDVLFTDIRMPGMTGLELISQVRALKLDTEIVIVTGYQDFEYAREAISYGAFDYCLKPIRDGATEEILGRLREKLDQKKKASERNIRDLVTGQAEHWQRLPLMAKDLRWRTYLPYFRVSVYDGHEGASVYRLFDAKDQLQAQVYELAAIDRIYCIENLADLDVDPFASWDADTAQVVIGRSQISKGLDLVPRLSEEANVRWRSLKWYKVYHQHDCIDLADTVCLAWSLRFVDAVQEIHTSNRWRLYLDLFLRFARKYHYSLDTWARLWNHVCLQLAYRLPHAISSTELLQLDWEELANLRESPEELIELLDADIKFLLAAEDEDKRANDLSQSGEHLPLILEFMAEHYHTDLSLQSLSERFYLSRNYICYLFQKHAEKTFTEHLNELRLTAAANRIVNDDEALMTIAHDVGFNDYSYFSKLFKKAYGVAPGKWRRQAGLGREVE